MEPPGLYGRAVSCPEGGRIGPPGLKGKGVSVGTPAGESEAQITGPPGFTVILGSDGVPVPEVGIGIIGPPGFAGIRASVAVSVAGLMGPPGLCGNGLSSGTPCAIGEDAAEASKVASTNNLERPIVI